MGSEDKSGRRNHLEPHSGTTDRCMHSDSHSGDVNGSWPGQHPDIIPELIGASGTSMHSDRSGSIDHFDINPLETIPDVAGENERGKHAVMHPVSESGIVFSVKNLRSFSSCSSSASSSSSEDLFLVDTGLGNFESHARPSKDEEITVSNNNSSNSKASDKSPGPTSVSQFHQVTSEPMVHNMPPTQSPTRQVMDRSGEYDPQRISSVIFERSMSLTPQEWSVASNESLFSIPIGNNSFSRDQFKSGELTKTEELIMFNPSPTIPELGADGEVTEFEKGDATKAAVKNAPKETTVDRIPEKVPTENVLRNPSDMSSHSNMSSRSFAFPILTDRVKSVTVKPDVAEKQRKKPLAAEATPKSSSICCCFSCFSFHPCSCSFSFFRCFCCLRCRGYGCCCCCR